MSTLIVGASSTIGKHLARSFKVKKTKFSTTGRKTGDFHLDLSKDHNDYNFLPITKTAVICAAESTISVCENDPQTTRFLKYYKTLDLVRHLVTNGTFVLILSTSLVFANDNDENHEGMIPKPCCEYARQKVDLEQKVFEFSKRTAVLRLSKVIHEDYVLFNNWIKSLKLNAPITPYSNKFFTPIWIEEVVNLITKILEGEHSGIWHLSGDKISSFTDASLLIAKHIGKCENLIRPKFDEQNLPIAGSVKLGMHRTNTHFNVLPQSFDDCMQNYLNKID